MEHFLIPWSFLRVRSDNIRYPLSLCSFGVGTIPPVPRFLRFSWLLTTYTSLTANIFLAAHAITACTLGTMGAPLPYRSPSFVGRPATGNPMFLARQKFDAFRFSVRPFPPFICGWLGRLTEYRTTETRVITTPTHPPEVHVTCRVNLSKNLPIGLEFKQCRFNHVHLTLT